MDDREPEVQELVRAGDVAAARRDGSLPDPLLDPIRPTGKHDVDTAFQLVLVWARARQPHGHELIEVRRLANNMGEEQLVSSSKEYVRQVVGQARRPVKSLCIDHVGGSHIDVR